VGRIDTVLRAGAGARVAFIATLAATLVLPVAAAVGVGVGLSLLLQLNQEAIDLKVVRLEIQQDGRFVESPAPASLAGAEVTILDVYGSLRFAGARTLQTRLPDPATSKQPVVVLRLRGRTRLGATGLIVLGAYANRLASADGHLYLSGVDPCLVQQLRTSRRIDPRLVTIIPATHTLLDSTREAYDHATSWLTDQPLGEPELARSDNATASSQAIKTTDDGGG
jgi:SulP family sulfate permease